MTASDPSDQVRVFDTTLRDGEQSPGCSMTPAQKRVFARALAELGVDVIETGFAASSLADMEACRAIAQDLRETTLCSLARCSDGDIDAAARALEHAARPRIHVFISTSPLHREHKLQLSREQVLERAVRGVERARGLVDDVEFSAEDALRTEEDFLVEIFSAAIAAGAGTINVPDTVGVATPGEMRGLFERLRARVAGAERVVFSAHCHNDLGLAVANSLAAIEGGARQVEVAVNGIGERAGNCALEELAMALRTRAAWYGVGTGIRTGRLLATSRLLTRLTGMGVQRNKAIVGANAFAHEAGIHQHGMLRHRGTYEIMRPEDVGWPATRMVLGRHSGRAAVADRLRALGYVLEDDALNDVFARFKALCETQRLVEDADLQRLVEGEDAAGAGWRIAALSVADGRRRAHAQVVLSDPLGGVVTETAEGDGPVAALFAAMARATGIALTLESYQVHSIGIGADARGEASLSVAHEGVEYTGTGTSRDIIEASALAWLDVANRVARKEGGAGMGNRESGPGTRPGPARPAPAVAC
ncbi:2-isopropylmalate synthase [Coralloluteibacterium thermophilus]|uniref:2-isopropylmalate synthase n=1 Tax=Coralloluteibacterium thermophilum TaxID=2707049 RepID=A0ABV9NE46_9GAMM